MKRFYLFILIVAPLVSFQVQAVSAMSISFTDCVITSTLRLGSRGPEVKCLQEKLKLSSVDGIFGPKTKVAVKNFQSSKGLVSDGIFGPISRLSLNAMLSNSSNYPAGCTSITGYSPTTGVRCDSNVGSVSPNNMNSTQNNVNSTTNNINTTITNPNLVNLDRFITMVSEVSKKNGSSDEEIKLITDTLRNKIVNSKRDYRKEFEKLLISESKLSNNYRNKIEQPSFFKKVFSFLGITPSVAQAITGTQFGGALVFSYDECLNFTPITIVIEPLPPTFIGLLSYTPGTEGFASYNIPFTSWLLGEYSPGGLCVLDWVPYIAYPTQGTILPMTGSSPT